MTEPSVTVRVKVYAKDHGDNVLGEEYAPLVIESDPIEEDFVHLTVDDRTYKVVASQLAAAAQRARKL